ncbi:MAG: PrsW family intramembrane metalloprotease [Halobacteriaceae archaeon]
MSEDESEDPIQRAAGPEHELYDIVDWEPRTAIDRAAISVYSGIVVGARRSVVLLAILIVLAQAGLVVAVLREDPVVAVYIALSIVPALVLAVYVRQQDTGAREPLALLVATFALGFLFAGFAAVLNSGLVGIFEQAGVVGLLAFFYLVVGPVEEAVKWLAIGLYPYRSPEFSTVVDGAVYGAMAGLGFATIENALYISQEVLTAAQVGGAGATISVAAVRSFAGPGHVIYSAFAGYYLGLAKFNADNWGPIVVKGLLVAALIHATYNAGVTLLPWVVEVSGLGISTGLAFVGFVILYDGLFLTLLFEKLRRYRRAFIETGAVDPRADDEESDEAGTA